ncbi:hypothetical protein HDU98_012356 [Podochytrium sp. JEL0797]|nr:hypothetical protein HDU98_012356 [Podochytrium sp. JEL0797]
MPNPPDLTSIALQTSLPHELIKSVFKWLSPNTVFKHKRLCRTICASLSDPHFAFLNMTAFVCLTKDNNGPKRLSLGDGFNNAWWFAWPDNCQRMYATTHLLNTKRMTSSHIQGGKLPAVIGLLVALKYLHLYRCNLTGSIPVEIGSLAHLIELRVDYCRVSGRIPSEITQLVSLTILSLQANAIEGRIPSEIGNLSQLKQLNLASNRLVGPIPTSIRALQNLESLDLSANQLEYRIAPEIGELKKLRRLFLFGNRFEGAVPNAILELESLREMKCGDQQPSGLQDDLVTSFSSFSI